MTPSIAIDMDNVIADLETHYQQWYEKTYGVKVSREKMWGVPELDAFPDKEAALKFLYQPGFFRSAPVMPGAQEALATLHQHFDIYIVSAAMQFPQSLHEKYEWLEEHFPFITWHKIIFCGEKHKIATDFMIDDYVKNLHAFSGHGILFTACHNSLNTYPRRVNNWHEATRYLFNSIKYAEASTY